MPLLCYILFGAWNLLIIRTMYLMSADSLNGSERFFHKPVFLATMAYIGRMLLLAMNKGGYALNLPLWPHWWRAAGCTVFDVLSVVASYTALIHISASSYLLMFIGWTALGSSIFTCSCMRLDRVQFSRQVLGLVFVAIAMVLMIVWSEAREPKACALVFLAGLAKGARSAIHQRFVSSLEPKLTPEAVAMMEGVLGTIICICMLWPLAYLAGGYDLGSWENIRDTTVMLLNYNALAVLSVVFSGMILARTYARLMLTKGSDTIEGPEWTPTLARPFIVGVVWIMSLALHRLTNEHAGETWAPESWFKFIALIVMSMGLYLAMSVEQWRFEDDSEGGFVYMGEPARWELTDQLSEKQLLEFLWQQRNLCRPQVAQRLRWGFLRLTGISAERLASWISCTNLTPYEMETIVSLWLVRAEKHGEIVQRYTRRLRWWRLAIFVLSLLTLGLLCALGLLLAYPPTAGGAVPPGMQRVPVPGWSTKSCADLKWKYQANETFPNVCGASHMHKTAWNPDRPGCFGKKIYSEAYRMCMDAGGRLCTMSEISGGVVMHTGCHFDYFRVWTSTPCTTTAGKEGRMTESGGNDKWEKAKNPETCIDIKDTTTLLPTRCCADRVPHAWRKPATKLVPLSQANGTNATAVVAKPAVAAPAGPVSNESLRNMAISVLVLLLIIIFLSIVLYFSSWERQLCGSYLVVTMLNQHGREFLKLNGEYRVFRSHREAYPRLIDNINTVISVIEAHYLSDIVATIGSVLLGGPSKPPETPLRSFTTYSPPQVPQQTRPFFESGSIQARDVPVQGSAPRPVPQDRAWPWDGFRFQEDGRPLTVAYVGRGPDGSLSGRVDRPGWGRAEQDTSVEASESRETPA